MVFLGRADSVDFEGSTRLLLRQSKNNSHTQQNMTENEEVLADKVNYVATPRVSATK
jgi:hypothetical protein